MDFRYFFSKRRKSVEKLIHEKKSGVTERPRSLNPGKTITMAISPIACARYSNYISLSRIREQLCFYLYHFVHKILLVDE